MDYSKFLSGTDIRGVAAEGVAGQPVDLTDEVCHHLANGFVLWLSQYLDKAPDTLTIAVGHDSRISANRISDAICKSFVRAGARVLHCGLSSTPAMFMITKSQFGGSNTADGAVQITASHHPFNRNGLKFFTADGGLNAPDVKCILTYAQSGEKPDKADSGEVIATPFMKKYAEILREKIKKDVNAARYDKPLEGFRIVVDAGNGAGGFYARDVLEPLGADTTGSLFLEPDGRFPNHIPNPEDKTAMSFICNATAGAHADLGVIFDTDVDRAGCVTVENGQAKELNRNRLVALASVLVSEDYPHCTVVTDSITSDGLRMFIEGPLKCDHHRFKRGYKNVINEAIRLNQEKKVAPLAIETSGHAAFMENFFLDDGAYLITKIISKMAVLRAQGQTLPGLLADLQEPAESEEIRFPILGEDWKKGGQRVLEALIDFTGEHPSWTPATDNFEGYRVNIPELDGWFLLRMSVHDPVMPLNLESNQPSGAKALAKALDGFFRKQLHLDLTAFDEFLK